MKVALRAVLFFAGCSAFTSATTTAYGQAHRDVDTQQAELAEAQARSHFETGSLAFAAGRYEDALIEFRKAYGLSPRPKLLYNIAVAADRLRRDSEALESFEAYLQARPNAPEREEVRSRIVVLRGSIGSTARPARDTTAEDPATTESDVTETAVIASDEDANAQSITPWILLGVGGVATVAGGVMFAVALMDKATVENAPAGSRLDEVEGAHGRVPLLSTLGVVTAGVGILTLGSALTWLALRPAEAPVEVRAGLHGISVAGAF